MITAPSISIDQLPSPSADASSQPATPAHRHPRRLPIQHHRKPPRRPYFCRFAPPRPQRTRRPVLLFVASPVSLFTPFFFVISLNSFVESFDQY
ncbi:hypothetical protein ACS0TY_024236 [Phlomoides rotata]